MNTISIQLDEPALKAATVQAINGILSPEAKEKIIQQAIESLLQPSKSSWEKGESPIEQIFRAAVMQVATETANKMVKEDTALKEKLDLLMREAAEKMLSVNTDKLSQKMADAFVNSIRRD